MGRTFGGREGKTEREGGREREGERARATATTLINETRTRPLGSHRTRLLRLLRVPLAPLGGSTL